MLEPNLITINIPGGDSGIPSHRLACWQWGGPQSRRVVLCAHGLTRNGRDFDFLAQELADDAWVLCPDMPGRGESDYLSDAAFYNYATYIYDMRQLLKQLHVDHVHWVGTSMGGIIGMMMASASPGLLQSLVLNDIGCIVAKEGLVRIAGYTGIKAVFNRREEAEQLLREIYAPYGIEDDAHWQHLLAHSQKTLPDGKITFAYDPAIAATFPKKEELKDIELWQFWEAVTSIPLLIIRGEKSDLFRRETAQEMLVRHPRTRFIEVPGTGHAPPLMSHKQIAPIHEWISAIC